MHGISTPKKVVIQTKGMFQDEPGSFFSANEGDLRIKERMKMEKINPNVFLKERKLARDHRNRVEK